MKLQQGAALVIPDLRVEVDVHQCHSWKCTATLYQRTRTEMVKTLQHVLHKLTALSQWFSHSITNYKTVFLYAGFFVYLRISSGCNTVTGFNQTGVCEHQYRPMEDLCLLPLHKRIMSAYQSIIWSQIL